jgi:hypothetical protein
VKLSEALEQLKDQWIAFRIVRDGEDPEGEVILHEVERSVFRERMRSERVQGVYITYSGEILPKGHVALF